MPERYHLITYGKEEELANRLTHFLAAVFSLIGLVILVAEASRTGDPYRIVSSAVFCGALSLLYVISTLYHTIRSPRARYVFRVLDHASIFLVIAASYTPFTLVSMREGSGWILFGVVWTLAIAGAIFKSFMINSLTFLAPVFYVGLGWLIVVDLDGLLSTVPPGGILWLVAGGLCYTIGLFFYAVDRIPYNHSIWHMFVVSGSVSHYLCVLWYVVPLNQSYPN